MSHYILVNFEGIIDDKERDAVEDALEIPVSDTRNILPYSPEDKSVEDYIFEVARNLLDPQNDWVNPLFILRPPEARPLFWGLFLSIFERMTDSAIAILDIQYTHNFPPEIDKEYTQIYSLKNLHQKAYQLRYSPVD